MLVLTRNLSEGIVIRQKGQRKTIRVTITKIRGNSVRLGIEAPPEFIVFRKELSDKEKYKEGDDDAKKDCTAGKTTA